jgi:hypothetical protein
VDELADIIKRTTAQIEAAALCQWGYKKVKVSHMRDLIMLAVIGVGIYVIWRAYKDPRGPL